MGQKWSSFSLREKDTVGISWLCRVRSSSTTPYKQEDAQISGKTANAYPGAITVRNSWIFGKKPQGQLVPSVNTSNRRRKGLVNFLDQWTWKIKVRVTLFVSPACWKSGPARDFVPQGFGVTHDCLRVHWLNSDWWSVQAHDSELQQGWALFHRPGCPAQSHPPLLCPQWVWDLPLPPPFSAWFGIAAYV